MSEMFLFFGMIAGISAAIMLSGIILARREAREKELQTKAPAQTLPPRTFEPNAHLGRTGTE
jgi:hypothetical protein